jgi:hypothetical protein
MVIHLHRDSTSISAQVKINGINQDEWRHKVAHTSSAFSAVRFMNRQASLKSLKVKVRWMASRHETCCQKGTSSLSRRSRSSPSNFSRERPAVVLIFFDLGRRCKVILFVAAAPLLAPADPNFLWNAPTPAELLIVLLLLLLLL